MGGVLTYKYPGFSGGILVGIDMNKAFKVLFNDVRDTFVVSSEAAKCRGKPKKALVVATAAALLMFGGAASAVTITNDNFDADHSSAFISGNGELDIQTNGDPRKTANELYEAFTTSNLGGIVNAFVPHDGLSSPTGAVGGQNLVDSSTFDMLDHYYDQLSGQFAGAIPEQVKPIFEKWHQLSSGDNPHLNEITGNIEFSKGTVVTVGGDSNPFIIAGVGADRVINASAHWLDGQDQASLSMQAIRQGDVSVNIQSGNVAGFVGASSAINLSNTYLLYEPDSGAMFEIWLSANSTNTTVNGSVNIGIDNTASIAGLIGAGSAIALGGSATSTVTGKTSITLNTQTSGYDLEGVSLGVIGGGLSAAMAEGTSLSEVQQGTTLALNQGLSAGVVGGGIAAASDTAFVEGLLNKTQIGQYISFEGEYWNEYGQNYNQDLSNKGGNATTAVKGGTQITAGADTASAMLMGGGIALSNSSLESTSSATATNEGTVTITLDGQNLTDTQKGAYQDSVEKLYKLGWTTLNQIISPDSEVNVDELLDQLQTSVDELNVPSVHVGNMGGGLAVARGTNNTIKSTAKTDVDRVVMNHVGGYNVANLAGGMAIAFGGSETGENGVVANSHVGEVEINITNGDSVLVAGGGAAYATTFDDEPGYNSMVTAQSTVDKATINVANQGTVVDGIFGGGIAVDDTNAAQTNATTTTNGVTINVSGGTVRTADLSVMDKFFDNALSDTNAPATVGTYVLETSGLVETAKPLFWVPVWQAVAKPWSALTTPQLISMEAPLKAMSLAVVQQRWVARAKLVRLSLMLLGPQSRVIFTVVV